VLDGLTLYGRWLAPRVEEERNAGACSDVSRGHPRSRGLTCLPPVEDSHGEMAQISHCLPPITCSELLRHRLTVRRYRIQFGNSKARALATNHAVKVARQSPERLQSKRGAFFQRTLRVNGPCGALRFPSIFPLAVTLSFHRIFSPIGSRLILDSANRPTPTFFCLPKF